MQQNHKIGRYNIELVESILWWDAEALKFEPAFKTTDIDETKPIDRKITKEDFEIMESFSEVMIKSKIKVWGKLIKEIKEKEAVIEFSEDWLKGLTREEGEALEEAINTICKKK